MNLGRLEKINALSREYCRSIMPTEVLKNRISAITDEKSLLKNMAGAALAAASFCIFFGGGAGDAVVAAFAGIMVSLFNRRVGKYLSNTFTGNFIISFITGVVIYMLAKLIPGLKPDKSIIGVIMLLIPGIAITNSIRDVIIGDTISGSMRFVESLFETVAIAIGYIAAILITGGGL